MPTIDLMEVLRTGSLGDIGPGVSRAQVERLLGPPDDVHSDATDHLLYGCLHLQLDAEGKVAFVSLMFDDRFPKITATLSFEPWGIEPGMTPEEFTELIRQAGLNCREGGGALPSFLGFVVGRHTTVYFEQRDEVYRLLAFTLDDSKEIWERPRLPE